MKHFEWKGLFEINSYVFVSMQICLGVLKTAVLPELIFNMILQTEILRKQCGLEFIQALSKDE